MKIFLKFFAMPLLIASVASALYIIDALIGELLFPNGSFMWVAFALWTIFYGVSIKDRIKGLIGVIIGFFAGVVMMLITGSFSLNLSTISISCLIGVFIVNGVVMTMNHAKKIWLDSVTGAFAGIFLTFSGLGVGLSPVASFSDGALMLGVLVLYAVLGLICGYISITVQNKVNKKLEGLNQNTQDKQPSDNTLIENESENDIK